MTYFVSDIHGEYDLFLRLLDKIRFSDSDTLLVLGDFIDKGMQSVALADFLRRQPNVKAILGNHEHYFLKYYFSLMQACDSGDDTEKVLEKLRTYFPFDEEPLSWETVDYIESLPLYLETDDYLCVHAGVEIDENGRILPMKHQTAEILVNSRSFKDPRFPLADSEKTVLFGHTPCSFENDSGEFIKTPKSGILHPTSLTDYSKIRLDCGVFLTGMFGALCQEDMREFYVRREG